MQCSIHQLDLYEDVRDITPMDRWLCPEPGCTVILASSQLAVANDQMWYSANGMTAPGWQELGDPGEPAT